MDRRFFLSTIAAGLATAALDPERLLCVPGQTKIFIPAPSEVRMFSHNMHPTFAWVSDYLPALAV